MKSVILDCGHGTHSRDVGVCSERLGMHEADLVRDIAILTQHDLSLMGISSVILDTGSYKERQSDWRVGVADLWVSIHIDAQTSKNPYALGLGRTDTLDLAERVVRSYAQHAIISRSEVGLAGSSLWPRGLVCFGAASCPAILLELGSLNHPVHDRLWKTPGIPAGALAEAIYHVLQD